MRALKNWSFPAYLLLVCSIFAQTKTARQRYFQLSETVFRLERVGPEPVGTGFLVDYKGSLYLVSAGHMSRTGDLQARIGESATLSIQHDCWVVHPSVLEPIKHQRLLGKDVPVQAVDVAVATVPRTGTIELQPIPLTNAISGDTVADAEPFQHILVIGYPKALGLDADRQRPLVRPGIVSMLGDKPYVHSARDAAVAEERIQVLDVHTAPGNSGSPVFLEEGFQRRAVLVGLISSGDEDLGIAYAEPVSRILETISYAADHKAPEAVWLAAEAHEVRAH